MAEASFETTRRIGGDLPVARLGYGAMRLSGQPGNWGPSADPEGAGKVLRRALEIGVNLIDTAFAYGAGLNEVLIAQSLQPYPKDLVIATKCGQTKMGPGIAYKDGRRKAIRTGCEPASSIWGWSASISCSCTGSTRIRRSRRASPRSPNW